MIIRDRALCACAFAVHAAALHIVACVQSVEVATHVLHVHDRHVICWYRRFRPYVRFVDIKYGVIPGGGGILSDGCPFHALYHTVSF